MVADAKLAADPLAGPGLQSWNDALLGSAGWQCRANDHQVVALGLLKNMSYSPAGGVQTAQADGPAHRGRVDADDRHVESLTGHILWKNGLVAPAPEAVHNPCVDIAEHDLVAEACESNASGLTNHPSTYHTDAADAARRPTLHMTPPSAHTPDIDPRYRPGRSPGNYLR